MTFNYRWMIAWLVVCLPLASCRKMEEAEEVRAESAAKVERLNGDDAPAQIKLTKDAARRLDVQTAAIEDVDVNGAKQKVMPYSALLYDTTGNTWAFANPQPLTYIREHIKIDRIEGDKALLAEGPPAGTQVVTVGAAELYGSEIEFEEE